jgi:hypothetical protein
MDRQKLIEDTIEIDKVNKDGKVFEKGKSPKSNKVKCQEFQRTARLTSW